MDARIDRLRALSRFETDAQMQEFDEILESLGAEDSNDPALLSDLLRTFIDDTSEHEHMWGLLHFVEGYPHELYVPTLVKSLPDMKSHARHWGVLLLLRVLNNPSTRALVREKYLTMSNSEQKQLEEYLSEIAQRSSELATRAAEITARQ